MSSVTIRDIAHDIQRDNPHLGSKADIEHVIKASLEVILERVSKDEKVSLRGFGVFTSKLYKGRELKSPLMNGGAISFEDQKVLRFRQSTQAKHRINNGDFRKVAEPVVVEPAESEPAAETPKKVAKKSGGKKKGSKKGSKKAAAAKS